MISNCRLFPVDCNRYSEEIFNERIKEEVNEKNNEEVNEENKGGINYQ